MNKGIKIALGLGAVAAAAALALSISKKSERSYDDEMDEDGCPLNKCGDCDSWDGDECNCSDECDDCDRYSPDGCCDECEESGVDMKTAVNNIVEGVMGGIVVAADKVSEVSTKLADYVASKLDERHESYSTEPISFSFNDDDADDTLAKKAKELGEAAVDAVKDTAEDVKEAAEDLFKDKDKD